MTCRSSMTASTRVVSANLLEHVPDDRRALAEMRRVAATGAHVVIVVPAGPGTYDYYDRFLGHERRYARGELAGKAVAAGLEVLEDMHLASLLYPAVLAREAAEPTAVRIARRRCARAARRARHRRHRGLAGRSPAASRRGRARACGCRSESATSSSLAEVRMSAAELSVVVPAYNEEANIDRVYARLRRRPRCARACSGS